MATIYGDWVGNWRAYTTYNIAAAGTHLDVEVTRVGMQVRTARNVSKISAYLSATGKTSYSDTNNTINIPQVTDGYRGIIKDKTYRWERSTKTQTVKLTGKVVSKSSLEPGTSTASVTLTINPLESWTVAYDANGGTGAPAAQKKYLGRDLKLTTNVPARKGYTFAGWASVPDGAASYQSGGLYKVNSAATLYAVWQRSFYICTFRANGGSPDIERQAEYDEVIDLSGINPTRAGHTLLGWSPLQGAGRPEYKASETYTVRSDATLYAVWQAGYVKPSITRLTAARSDPSGLLDDGGEHAKVSFALKLGREVAQDGTATPLASTVKVRWRAYEGAGPWNQVTREATADSSMSVVISGLAAAQQYDIEVEALDTKGSFTAVATVSEASFSLDFSANGRSIAAFGAATDQEDGVFNVMGSLRQNGIPVMVQGDVPPIPPGAKLLWQRTSTEATTEASTVDIDTSAGYEDITIEASISATSTMEYRASANVGGKAYLTGYLNIGDYGTGMSVISRKVTINASTIEFDDAYVKKFSSTSPGAANNKYLIPRRVVGRKKA